LLTYKNKVMAKNNVILGLLAGAAAGAVAGILLAPEKGSETRKNLSRRSRDTVDGIRGKVNDLVDTVADKYLSGSEGGQRGQSSRTESGMSSGRQNSGTERSRSSESQAPGAPSVSGNSFQ
jgi:gas vesicle protein